MDELIRRYKLIPHPEGGYYREIYRSNAEVRSPVTRGTRNAVTHIYFLLLKGQVSRFHRVLHDEIWNFYDGAPMALYRYDGDAVVRTEIGPGCSNYALIINGGDYQAAESTGDYSLVGCSVAPGFDFEDFSFLADDPAASARFKSNHEDVTRFL